VELGAAERLDAAGLVDHLDCQFRRGDAADADLGHAAGSRIERAAIDGIGGPAAQRHSAECARRERGLQEFAATLAGNDRLLVVLLHFAPPAHMAPVGLTRLLSYIWRRIPCHTQSARRTKVRMPCEGKRRAPQHEEFHALIASSQDARANKKAADLAERWAAFPISYG